MKILYAHKKATLMLIGFFLFSSVGISQQLRTKAEEMGVYLGNIMDDALIANTNFYGGAPASILNDHFNILVTENAMKMGYIIPHQPSDPFNLTIADLNVSGIDTYVAFARARGMRTRGHAYIWYHQAPPWLLTLAPTWNAQQIRDFSRSYIQTLGSYCKGKIDEWDVVNEMWANKYDNPWARKKIDQREEDQNGNKIPGVNKKDVWYINLVPANQRLYDFDEDGNPTTEDVAYNNAVNQYIRDCFYWAREVDNEAELFYNDFTIGSISWNKATSVRNALTQMKHDGVPIDGAAFQAHWTSENLISNLADEYVLNIREYAKEDLLVHITEFDVRQLNNSLKGEELHEGYWNVTSKMLAEPNCNTLLFWGIRDSDSWIDSAFPGHDAYILWDENYNQNGYFYDGGAVLGPWTGVYDGLSALTINNFPPSNLVGDGNPGNGGGGSTGGGSGGQIYGHTVVNYGTYVIHPFASINAGLNNSMDIAGGSSQSSAPMVQWAHHGAANQQWKFIQNGNGSYQIINQNGNKCLQNVGGNTIKQRYCNGGQPNQSFWLITVPGTQIYTIKNDQSQICIDIPNGSTAQGQAVQQYACDINNPNQQFDMEGISSSRIGRIEKISIHPNPSHGIITFDGVDAGSTVKILNKMGSLQSTHILGVDRSIDLTKLSQGVYIISVNGQVFKLIKK